MLSSSLRRVSWVAVSSSTGFVEIQPFLHSVSSPVAFFESLDDAELFRRSKFLDDLLNDMDQILLGGLPADPDAQARVWFNLQCLAVSGRSFGRRQPEEARGRAGAAEETFL
ncbi:MAG: hypothetical protein HQL75_18660 [Magnetococcales bacterium]|nr:hypothetical protein [Magnetococcales bacterium]